MTSTPATHITPANPARSSTAAIPIWASHWVGSQSAVSKGLRWPGLRIDQPPRSSCPMRRWK